MPQHTFTVSCLDGIYDSASAAVDAWHAAFCPVPKGSSVWVTECDEEGNTVETRTLSPSMSMTRDVCLEPPCRQ